MEKSDQEKNQDELRLIDETLSKGKLESPSSNFTHRVMINLHSMPAASSLSPRNGLLLLCGTFLAVVILTVIVGTGVFDTYNPTISLERLTSVPLTENINIQKTIPISGNWLLNGLVLLNIVLAFVLLDRTILRPFFNKRMSNF